MVHSLPDYTSKFKNEKIFDVVDIGEAAVRLGSPSMEDRRGNVIWFDDFEGVSTKWDTTAAGAGASAALNAEYSWRGDNSFRLTTANTTDAFAFMQKRFTPPSDYLVGAECHVRLDEENCYFDLHQQGWTPTDSYLGSMRILPDTYELQIRTGLLVWTTISTDAFTDIYEELWIMLKLVIDWNTKTYVRAIVGHNEYDLSAYNLLSMGAGPEPCHRINMRITTEEDDNHSIYVDNFILTQNE